MSETPSVDKAPPVGAPAAPVAAAAPPPVAPPRTNRRPLVFALLGLAALLVIALYFLVPGFYEKGTDDAYVEAHIISVIAKVPAYAQVVYVDDNNKVAAGQLLVQLDPRDYAVLVSQAQANLTNAQGKLEDARNQIPIADADIARQRAELDIAQANAKLADVNLGRLQSVSDVRAVSSERVDEGKAAAASMRASVVAAQVRIQAAQAQATLARSQVKTAEAAVAQAHAVLDQATLNLSYTKIYSTEAGSVASKSVESGNYVQPGQLLLSVVPDKLFVIANYKETQLTHVRPGQAVTIRVDAFPDLHLRGHVDSIQRGTGSRFALLPPENATGNFVKVVQRVPVKITFDDPGEALRWISPGMSVETRIYSGAADMAWFPELAGRSLPVVAPGRSAYAMGVLAWLAIGLGGCTVGPDYVAPKTTMPAAYTEHVSAKAASPLTPGAMAAASPVSSSATPDMWWKNFDDPVLDQLDNDALQSAPDLAMAEARVREARALRGVAGAAQYPELDAGAGYDRTRGSANVPLGVPPGGLGPGINGNLWQAGFDASWEIDVFGGTRRSIEAATRSYQAATDDRGDVVLTLLAEVARNYIELRGAQRRIAVAQDNLTIQQDALTLTRALYDAGLASQLDVLRAQAQVSDTQAAIPLLVVDAHGAIYRIGALVGRPPEDLVAELDTPQPIPSPVADVPVGLPSDLLKRRPDIRAAERRLAAANARIGVAQADLYPHFSLTGVAGLESLDASSFLTAPSRYFSIGPSISWLIFDAGKVRFTISAEQARTDRAAAAYQQTVLDALRDVETALVSYGQSRVRRERLAAEVEADRGAVSVSTRLYRQGLDDFLPVLDAERSLYAADDKLAQTDRDTSLALVRLYKSLGGGWEENSNSTAAAGSPIR